MRRCKWFTMLSIILLFVITNASLQAQATLPVQEGELMVDGLNDRVEILRDEFGIPHIYASNSHDLFFAQGFTQAQDRWWQMEFSRHVGNGEIGEITGRNADVLSGDIFLQTLNFRDVVEQEWEMLNSETRAALQAFTDGVNAYILTTEKNNLAFEYSALALAGIDLEVEAWTPFDTLVWGKAMALNLSGNMASEQIRSTLYATIGQEMTDQWAPAWPFGEKPTIVQPEDLPVGENSLVTMPDNSAGLIGIDTHIALPDTLSPNREIGSNNWVVNNTMSASGLPLLANDPHLSIQMPSIWYEIGLHCEPVSTECPFNVVGFSLPATPGITIGHNEHIAWGVTNAINDTQDLYRIKVNPDNPLQYEWNGAMRDMIVREAVIHFGDAEPITIQVRHTHLGPIINDNQLDEKTGMPTGFNNEDPLALRWTALEPGTLFQASLLLNQASNWQEFRTALSYWDTPAQNFVYADVEGNIGYQLPGRIPIRAADHSGLLPVDGSTDAFEWRGFLPYDSLPRILNPQRDYIATANQAIVPLEYYGQLEEEFGSSQNYFISQEWAWGYRGQRINELLETTGPHTVDSFQAIQGDNKLISAEELMPFIADLSFDDPSLTDMRDWLLDWDYQLDSDSPQAALYMQFWSRLLDNLYNDQLGSDITSGGGSQEMWATYLLAQQPDNIWWDIINTPDVVETRDDTLRQSFREAVAVTTELLGKDRSAWRWGDLHTATFVNQPLGQSGVELVENLVNRGPVATGGGNAVINATGWGADIGAGDFAVRTLPSLRIIVDLSDFSNSVSMHTTGQSGHATSPHYDDLIDSWRTVQYHPLLWTREDIENAAVQTLTLLPNA
ncbi:MAG: penicillin acylase family protein [Chloroflexi bacterium]|nr:MAG: penicillin acylase family protein [Chloroflexota bacterium]